MSFPVGILNQLALDPKSNVDTTSTVVPLYVPSASLTPTQALKAAIRHAHISGSSQLLERALDDPLVLDNNAPHMAAMLESLKDTIDTLPQQFVKVLNTIRSNAN